MCFRKITELVICAKKHIRKQPKTLGILLNCPFIPEREDFFAYSCKNLLQIKAFSRSENDVLKYS